MGATPALLAEMVRRLGAPGDEGDRRTCRRRRKAETVMSVAKRRWGEALSARTDAAREARALPWGVVHDLSRLVGLDYAGRSFRRDKSA